MNLRPSGYEPDELPNCSIPRHIALVPETGIEPVRSFRDRRILSPVRLPVPPPRHLALRVGLEPTTYRLTAGCSTIELPRIIDGRIPTLPWALPHSTIGAKRLNFCVRDGYRCIPFAIFAHFCNFLKSNKYSRSSFRYISIS